MLVAEDGVNTSEWLKIYSFDKKGVAQRGDVYNVTNSLNNAIEEIEAIIKTTGTEGYKFFTYDVDGNIIRQDIYADTAGLEIAYVVTYGYTGDDLTLITIVRSSDSFTYTKTFAYDINSNLESITIEQI